MSASPIPFAYAGAAVRVVVIDGEPWFVLTDLCKVLGIVRSASNVAQRVDPDGVREAYPILDGLSRTQHATLVNESGMYEVVIRSDKPEAVTFRRWITAEVLPQIRRTGTYGTPALTDDELIHKALTISVQRVEALTAKVAELEGPAAAWESLVDAEGDLSVSDAAKTLSRDPHILIGRDRLFRFMQSQQWVYRHDKHWRANQRQVDCGRLAEKVGNPYYCTTLKKVLLPEPTVRVTAKGLAELQKRLGGGRQLALVVP